VDQLFLLFYLLEYLHEFQVPYELLNKKFRAAQKCIDREVAHIHSAGSDLEVCLQEKNPSIGDVTKAIDNVVEKLCLLKRKVSLLLSPNMFCCPLLFAKNGGY